MHQLKNKAVQKKTKHTGCNPTINADIFRSLNNNKYVGATYIEYKKAFDTIGHDKLITKLQYYGFSPEVTAWFKSYLSARVQKTVANGTHSDWESISFGVPQGSILGPILLHTYHIVHITDQKPI